MGHFEKMKRVLREYLCKYNSVKLQFCLFVLVKKVYDTDEIQHYEPWFISNRMVLNTTIQTMYLFDLASEQIVSRFECFQYSSRGSLSKTLSVDIQIIKIILHFHSGAATLAVCHQDFPGRFKIKALLKVTQRLSIFNRTREG